MENRLTWVIAGLVVTWSLTVIGAVWAVSAERTEILSDVQANQAQLADHEKRIRVIEQATSEMANDVRWIRRALGGREGD